MPKSMWQDLVPQLPTVDVVNYQRCAEITELGLETKECSCWPRWTNTPPAELACALSMPKPSVTMYVSGSSGRLVRREIDTRICVVTPPAHVRRRKTLTRGLALVSSGSGARLARLSSAQQSEFAMLLEKLS